jgi:hypothetical protein
MTGKIAVESALPAESSIDRTPLPESEKIIRFLRQAASALEGIDAVFYRITGDEVFVLIIIPDNMRDTESVLYELHLRILDYCQDLRIDFSVVYRGKRALQDVSPAAYARVI